MNNNRDSNRIGLVIDIKLTCDAQCDYILKSRNISDSGVFLELNGEQLNLPLGTQVVLQVCAQLGEEPAPPVKAEIVHITDEGLGLHFIL